jgi:CSLREA domain-containing protein
MRLIFLVLSLTVLCGSVRAANFQVNTTLDTRDADLADGVCVTLAGECSLRAAIEQANALASSDLIALPPGDYALSLVGANEDAAASGDLDLSGNLAIVGGDAASTRVLGSGDRVFDVRVEAVVSLTRIGIHAGGNVNSGGGIQNAGTLVLTSCDVSTNGGDTRTVLSGGGIFNLGLLTVSGGSISDNQVQGGTLAPVSGGGVYSTTGMLLSGVRIENNRALGNLASGGGVGAIAPGLVQIVNSELVGNQATAGGALAVTGAAVTVTGSLIAGNTALRGGGGARVQGGTLELVDSTLSGNSAREDGGGVAASSGAVSSYNSTLADNLADADANGSGDGGALSQSGSASVSLRHTLVAANLDGSATTRAPDCAGAVSSNGYNLVGSTQGCAVAPQSGDRLDVDAQLGLLADNGGASLTHALQPGSVAIDGGDPAGCFNASAQPIAVDQRGFPRPRDGDQDQIANCDIGAFELQPAAADAVFASGFE